MPQVNLKDEWGTPQKFFDELDAEFNITLDPCGNPNRLLKPRDKMITLSKDQNGLKGDWTGHTVFVNPPFSGNNLKEWLGKCYEQRHIARDIIAIMPSNRTGAKYFHDFVVGSAEIGFIPGRLQYVPLKGQKVGSNPMNTILALWQSGEDSKFHDIPGALQDFEEKW